MDSSLNLLPFLNAPAFLLNAASCSVMSLGLELKALALVHLCIRQLRAEPGTMLDTGVQRHFGPWSRAQVYLGDRG